MLERNLSEFLGMRDPACFLYKRYFIVRFIKFLKEKGLYQEFIEERKKSKNSSNFTHCKKYYRGDVPNFKGYINNAFEWRRSKRGFDFWSEVNGEWGKIVEYITIEYKRLLYDYNATMAL